MLGWAPVNGYCDVNSFATFTCTGSKLPIILLDTGGHVSQSSVPSYHHLHSALLDKPERWRKRAEEIRTIADGMRDPEAKRFMPDLAKSYEVIAKLAEDRKNAARP